MSYTEADQRADTAFLVGVRHGREVERVRIERDMVAEWRSLPVWGPNPQGLHILDDCDHESLMDDVRRICRDEPSTRPAPRSC